MVGSARRVLRAGDSGDGPFDAIVLEGLDRVEDLSSALSSDGFFVLRLRGASDDARLARLLDERGLVAGRIELADDEAVVQAFRAPASLRTTIRDLQRQVAGQAREIQHLEAHAAQQQEGIAWLRHELDLAHGAPRRFDHLLSGVRRRARGAYVTGYTRVVAGVGRHLPRSVKSAIKRVWNPWPRQEVSDIPISALSMAGSRTSTYDVICFSIIDWSFRWQRPQQLMSKLADAGHRVFYLNTSQFLPAPHSRLFELLPLRDNVWEVRIAPPVPVDVYSGRIPGPTEAWFPKMLDALRAEAGIAAAISVVHVATWAKVAFEARGSFGWAVVYDCMDEWRSFPGMSRALLATEEELVSGADLVTVSGARLLAKWRGTARNITLVRNAADFDFYTSAAKEDLLADVDGPIAGYFGALASWFDVELLRRAALARPDVTFVLIGGVFDVRTSPLSALPNVRLLGQRPYATMPSYLAAFDVCLIPFVVDEITAATDPVKFYEYISLGKPVVATAMPELAAYADVAYLATSSAEFLAKLDAALLEDDPALRERRIAVARENTWTARAGTMLAAVRDLHPRVSIIVVTYGNWQLTRLCLDAVFRTALHPNLEVIVVDNASSDETPRRLTELAATHAGLRVILNDENRGFAAANNQGLDVATGDVLVLLNNDTVPARGWLPRMLRHLQDREIGIVNAVTNFSGNESRIEVPYTSLEDMPAFAEHYATQHDGESFDIHVAAMYCVGMRRDAFERIGALDESFRIGMFEDDDYSHRARLAGYRVICAEDVFVHHFGQASFRKIPEAEYEALFRRNRSLFEQKWGIAWRPHTYR
jgi:GT2 family glycosyltransferase/glycosyltransferase involved in cell wall biosynthesis